MTIDRRLANFGGCWSNLGQLPNLANIGHALAQLNFGRNWAEARLPEQLHRQKLDTFQQLLDDCETRPEPQGNFQDRMASNFSATFGQPFFLSFWAFPGKPPSQPEQVDRLLTSTKASDEPGTLRRQVVELMQQIPQLEAAREAAENQAGRAVGQLRKAEEQLAARIGIVWGPGGPMPKGAWLDAVNV